MNDQQYAAGSVIFRPGSPGKWAYLIREGTVELLREQNRIAQYGPGEVFGEMSLIEERPHALTAQAMGLVKLSALTREEFEQMLTSDPATFRTYLKALFERLRVLSAAEEVPLAEPVDDAPGISPALAAVYPSVTIHPLTRRAAETLPDEGLMIPKFPFRIGRASEVKELEPLDLNDLWLLDREPFNISRNHAVIDLQGDAVVVKDRGTHLGMHVNDVYIGGASPQRQVTLHDGDNVMILGARMSRYHFRIHVARG